MKLDLFLGLLASLFLSSHGSAPLPNIPYGSDPAQVLDFYLAPQTDGGSETKVIILIHGGAWGAGQKVDMQHFVAPLQNDLPTYYVANMEYRLGTHASPGFPKQLEDIYLAMVAIKSFFTQQNVTFGLMGGSAGAHLAMLYSYAWDRELGLHDVKAVINLVGPTDSTHPDYTEDPVYDGLFFNLVGGCRYSECPEIYNATSPYIWVTEVAPPTIGFYGNADPLIPNSQMPIIRDALDRFGVPNNFTVYPGGHADWELVYQLDMMAQIKEFITEYW